jgi:hypothetical protein
MLAGSCSLNATEPISSAGWLGMERAVAADAWFQQSVDRGVIRAQDTQ